MLLGTKRVAGDFAISNSNITRDGTGSHPHKTLSTGQPRESLGNMLQDAEHHKSTLPIYQSTGSSAPAAQTAEPAEPKHDYDAFVSYRRGDATRLAQWIRNRLQHFRLPPKILAELPHNIELFRSTIRTYK